MSRGDEDELLECNKEMTKKYRSVLMASGTDLIAFDEEIMPQKSFGEKYSALLCIAQCLSRVINIDRCDQALLDVAKVGLEYAAGKIGEGGEGYIYGICK